MIIDDDIEHWGSWQLYIPTPEEVAFDKKLNETMDKLAAQREIDLSNMSPEMFDLFYDECYILAKQ